ncbi:glycine receptor subunit alpha-2-like [Ruditapes philippinarum]|uniref:glycine receptor subunit alpha-2-like n=1 Tax=Ruditapes philippinarum TaxID=129788 RepID=UPI00295C0A58|nr:glycine receptor subunit alpha-2-like [Ruditapes philippinarum]
MKLLIFLIPTLYAQTDLSKYNLIEHLVGSNSTYKKDVKPDILTIVTVQVDIYDIARNEEKNTGFLFDLYLRMWWKDRRLNYSQLANYSKLELSEGKTKQIWQPDVYFLTDRSPGSNEQKTFNSMVYIHKNGEIVYSQRTSMALRSSFDLKYYPYDEQVCELKMQSFTYTNDSLILKWKKDNPLKLSGVHMTEFLISVGEYSDDDTPLLDQVGDYSTLKGRIIMERTGGAHFFQLYGPSVAILFVSWLALFIDEKRISPRLSVHTGCIIALITRWVGIYFIIPAVSYVRAIDVWMIIHQVLIVCAFLANILSLMARRDDPNKDRTFKDSKNEERLLQRLNYITYCVKETKPFKYLCCNCFKRFCCYCEAELDSNESSVISSNNRQAKLIEIVAIIALFGHYIIFLIVYTTCVPSHKVSVIFLLCIGTTGLLCWIFLVALLFCCMGNPHV